MQRADKIMEWVRGPHVLDVGCAAHIPEPGNPYWVHGRLRHKFPEVAGIDISEENIELLKRQGYRNLHVASAESFSLSGQFDTVFSGELIEHLANPGAFLTHARDHLKDGGRIVLTTPYPFALLNLAYAFLKFPKTCQNGQHTCWFCPQTLKVLAERVELKIVHWELIEDYRLDALSWKYRWFVRSMSGLGWIIPDRLRKNAMLFVLEKHGPQVNPIAA